MVRIRHGWLVAALALSVGAAACKKDENKTAPAATATGGGATATAPAAGGAPAAATGDDLSLLPVDSEVVLGLNFSQLQKSALWQKFVQPQLMKDEAQKKLAEFQTKCGFDPMAAISSVSMGLKGVGADKPDGVLVVHGPEKAKVLGCLDKMKGEAEAEGTTITTEQDVVTIKSKDGDNFAFTYVNDTTLVGVVGANANAAGVQAAAKGGSALKTSPAFVEMYGKIKTADSLWLLMNGNSKAFDQAAAMGFKPKAVFGSVNVTDGLAVDMRIRLESPDQAKSIADMANGQVGQFKAMVDKLDIANDGADVKFIVAMSSQKLEALIGQFAGMMGGLGGGM